MLQDMVEPLLWKADMYDMFGNISGYSMGYIYRDARRNMSAGRLGYLQDISRYSIST